MGVGVRLEAAAFVPTNGRERARGEPRLAHQVRQQRDADDLTGRHQPSGHGMVSSAGTGVGGVVTEHYAISSSPDRVAEDLGGLHPNPDPRSGGSDDRLVEQPADHRERQNDF